MNPVQVVGVDAHTSLHSYEYRGDFLLGDAAPFDAMGERCDGRCPWVVDSVILQGGTLLVFGYHIMQHVQSIYMSKYQCSLYYKCSAPGRSMAVSRIPPIEGSGHQPAVY